MAHTWEPLHPLIWEVLKHLNEILLKWVTPWSCYVWTAEAAYFELSFYTHFNLSSASLLFISFLLLRGDLSISLAFYPCYPARTDSNPSVNLCGKQKMHYHLPLFDMEKIFCFKSHNFRVNYCISFWLNIYLYMHEYIWYKNEDVWIFAVDCTKQACSLISGEYDL